MGKLRKLRKQIEANPSEWIEAGVAKGASCSLCDLKELFPLPVVGGDRVVTPNEGEGEVYYREFRGTCHVKLDAADTSSGLSQKNYSNNWGHE